MAAANRLRGHAFDPAYFLSLDFIAPGQARAPWLGTNLAGSYRRGPATWAQAAQEMESARDDLAAIGGALKNPAATSVVNYRNLGVSSVVAKRAAAQWLAFESIEQLHRNDLAGAQDALRAVTALARLHRNDLTLVNQMIRVAIAGLAFDATWPALQVPGWTEPQLAELQSQWQQLEFSKMLASTIEMERASVGELFDRSRTNGLKQTRRRLAFTSSPGWNIKTLTENYVIDPLWRVAWAEQDELFYLETMQRVLEALRSASRHKSWTRLSVELTETYDRIEARFKALDSFRFTLSGMALGNWRRAFENVVRLETQRSLMMAALALQRYQLRHGKLPPDLDALAPEFLAAVPVDYMNGQPLHYRAEPDGSFRLYSWDWTGRTTAAILIPSPHRKVIPAYSTGAMPSGRDLLHWKRREPAQTLKFCLWCSLPTRRCRT
jgi:type II secretory pathway pseudopilin PulG